jgi:hypothetical protein
LVAEPKVKQPTFFDEPGPAKPTAPAQVKPKLKVIKSKPLARGEFEPVSPQNLAQESAIWLTGQHSIAEQRGKRYVAAGVKHPGKMQPDVAGALIDTYTEPGWHVVDFMGGQGTTGVEGAERGRHVTIVELVRHWANVAYANGCRTMYRGASGSIRVICGDARALPKLLGGAGADAVLTSPAYGDTRVHCIPGAAFSADHVIREGEVTRGYDAAVCSPVYGASRISPIPSGVVYAEKGQIYPGNLPRGYDAAVVSPPFGPTQTGRGMALTGINGDERPPVERGIGATYDASLVSPPYGPAEGNGGGRGLEEPAPKPGEWADYESGQGPSPGWRGYRSRAYAPVNADAVITSPAYGDIRQDGGAHQFGDNSAMDNYSGDERVKSARQRDHSNVGNKRYGAMDKALALIHRLKAGETIPPAKWPGLCYLEDMALIYWGAKQILKPGGLIILVLKDYRRNKARVNLVGDTMRLLEAIGFIYHDRALALTSKIDGGQVISKVSPFVRVNARKPEKSGGKVMLPAGEEVLVFRKE